MTYKESYEKCKALEELREEVMNDIATARMIGNPDRLNAIKKIAEEVANEKFNFQISDLLGDA